MRHLTSLGDAIEINGLHRRQPPIFRLFPKLVQKSLLNRAIPGARSLLAAAVDGARSASAAPFAKALADAMIGLALQWLVAFFQGMLRRRMRTKPGALPL